MAQKAHDPSFTIDEVVSSSDGLTLVPSSGQVSPLSRVLEDVRPFSFEAYAEEIHMPAELPDVDVAPLQRPYPRCLDMPIRLAGDSVYSLPKEWEGLAPLIEDIIAVEHAHNENWQDYFTYITVDSSYVEPFKQQRHGGLHVDGFQGSRINPKTKITRNYVVTTNGGTRFYPQRFIVADETKFNIFQGFDIQAEQYVIAEENLVYFMDAYTVHESGFAERAGLRTFLRVTYDLKKFDRLGNTHNNMLDYEWEMFDRKIHDVVAEPNYVDLENSPYFPKA